MLGDKYKKLKKDYYMYGKLMNESLKAEIKVGKRRVIESFIYPLIQYLDEGL